MSEDPKGLHFPLVIGNDGRFLTQKGISKITQNLKRIAATDVGERVMEPNMGSTAFRSIFRPLTVQSAQVIQNQISKAFIEQEPRARVTIREAVIKDDVESSVIYTMEVTRVDRQESEQVELEIIDGF